MKELILGGARSGKSALAGRRANESGLAVTVVATAQPGDAEMAARIRQHRKGRPADWTVVEEPIALAATLQMHAARDRCLLVDCLTLWLSNLLHAGEDNDDDGLFARERHALLEALPGLPGHIILISNEVGMGVVPMGALTRRFCDEAGRLHQDLAQLCDRVTLVAAGLPLALKGDVA
jgi:adenosylcobinamide kinase/adenosylcobinamide-phosphate guanylyltransferase